MTATLEQLTMLVGALGGIKDGIEEAGRVSRHELQPARDLCIRAEGLLSQIRAAATGEADSGLTEEEARNLWRCVEEVDVSATRFIRRELERSAS